MAVEIEVLDDPAARVVELLLEAAGAGGQIVLTGGSTPRRAYEQAAKAGADWSRATIWFSDERCVGPQDPLSNFALADRALLSRLPEDQQPDVMRMEGELGPEIGAANYEARLRERLGGDPRWDLLLLGLGPDSHCASLFPGKPELQERSRLVTGVEQSGWDPFVSRISLTLPALNAARRTIFLVTGADKAPAVKRAFGDPVDPASPSAMVRPKAGELLVLCDAAAAAELG
jgi:6-phosphogluconolactonase